MKKYKLGFIGCGHMGFSIAQGIKNKEFLKASDICIYDTNPTAQEKCKKEGFICVNDYHTLCENSEIVILAITPQISHTVIESIKEEKIDCILSIVTGLSISYLKSIFQDSLIVRAMPNTPLQVGYGATAIASSDPTHPTSKYIVDLFSSIGLAKEVDEEKFPLLVSVHGSTPAYFYYFTQCILEDLINRGFDETIAREFLVETLIGSGQLLKEEPNKPLSEFVDAVCSKGGTTIQAINHFKENGLAELVKDANEKCIERAKEFEQ